jgi:hypothetical protein
MEESDEPGVERLGHERARLMSNHRGVAGWQCGSFGDLAGAVVVLDLTLGEIPFKGARAG